MEDKQKRYIKEYYKNQDSMLRLFRGDLSLDDINKMTKKEQLYRIEARMEAYEEDAKRQQSIDMQKDINKLLR